MASHSVVDVRFCLRNFFHLKSKKSKIKYPKSIKIHFSKPFKHKPSQTCSTGALYTPRFPFFQGRKLTTKWVLKIYYKMPKKCCFCGIVEIENVQIRVTTKWVKKKEHALENMHLKKFLWRCVSQFVVNVSSRYRHFVVLWPCTSSL